jgi:hypothetical protein
MPSSEQLSVKAARLAVDRAMDAARKLGIPEEQLKSDQAVRTATEDLTLAQTAEHLQLLRSRKDSAGRSR